MKRRRKLLHGILLKADGPTDMELKAALAKRLERKVHPWRVYNSGGFGGKKVER